MHPKSAPCRPAFLIIWPSDNLGKANANRHESTAAAVPPTLPAFCSQARQTTGDRPELPIRLNRLLPIRLCRLLPIRLYRLLHARASDGMWLASVRNICLHTRWLDPKERPENKGQKKREGRWPTSVPSAHQRQRAGLIDHACQLAVLRRARYVGRWPEASGRCLESVTKRLDQDFA